MKKPKYHRPRTVDNKEVILKMFHEGKSIAEIAETVELTPRSVRRILNYAGINLTVGAPKKILDEDMPRIYNLLRRRETSYDALASEFGVTVNTIRKRVRDYEFERKRRLANGITAAGDQKA